MNVFATVRLFTTAWQPRRLNRRNTMLRKSPLSIFPAAGTIASLCTRVPAASSRTMW